MKIMINVKTKLKGHIDRIFLSFQGEEVKLQELKYQEISWESSMHCSQVEDEIYFANLRGIYCFEKDGGEFYLNSCLNYFKNCQVNGLVFCTDDEEDEILFSIQDFIVIDGDQVYALKPEQYKKAIVQLEDF